MMRKRAAAAAGPDHRAAARPDHAAAAERTAATTESTSATAEAATTAKSATTASGRDVTKQRRVLSGGRKRRSSLIEGACRRGLREDRQAQADGDNGATAKQPVMPSSQCVTHNYSPFIELSSGDDALAGECDKPKSYSAASRRR
jgi:hypothetical protein